MSFTPGPWLVRTSPTCIGRCFAIGTLQNIDRGHGYATLYDDRTSLNPFGDGEAEANANLISAAPDMFAAIDAADTAFAVLNVQDLGGQARACIREAWPLVQSARAKARPESWYADAVSAAQQHEIARLDAVVADLRDRLADIANVLQGCPGVEIGNSKIHYAYHVAKGGL